MKNTKKFDPFTDRLARDIRNGLSTSFSHALQALDSAQLEKSAAKWAQSDLPEAMAAYVKDRIQRYGRVLDRVQSENEIDPRRQALLAWNEQLYFEVHEILEEVWQPATGDRRKALQGLILAAGIGEHMLYDHTVAAERLSIRADQLIRQHRPYLNFIENLDDLLNWLPNWKSAPPKLQASGDK